MVLSVESIVVMSDAVKPNPEPSSHELNEKSNMTCDAKDTPMVVAGKLVSFFLSPLQNDLR